MAKQPYKEVKLEKGGAKALAEALAEMDKDTYKMAQAAKKAAAGKAKAPAKRGK